MLGYVGDALSGAGGLLLAATITAAARWALQARDTARDTNHMLTALTEANRVRDRRLDATEARLQSIDLWRAGHPRVR